MKGNPLSSSLRLISGVEDIKTISCGYIERGEVREKNSFDFLKSFIFPTTLNFFFFFKKTVKNRKITISVAHFQTRASLSSLSKTVICL